MMNKIMNSDKEHLRNNVLHVNFHGAARDQLVDQNNANFNRFGFLNNTKLLYAIDVKTTQLKNLY